MGRKSFKLSSKRQRSLRRFSQNASCSTDFCKGLRHEYSKTPTKVQSLLLANKRTDGPTNRRLYIKFFFPPPSWRMSRKRTPCRSCSFDVHFRNIRFTFNPRDMKERWRSAGTGWILNSADCSSKPRRSSYPATACVLRVEKSSGTAEGCKEKGRQGNIPKGRKVMKKPNASNVLANRLHIPIAKQAYSESGG